MNYEIPFNPSYRIHSNKRSGHLGAASKPNRRLTGGSVQFRAVVIVKNNRNRAEPDGTTGQPAVGFWSRPLDKSFW